METTEDERLVYPDRLYKGFTIDLLYELQRRLHFTSDLHTAHDGFYGILNETTNTWNGMVGEVMRGVI